MRLYNQKSRNPMQSSSSLDSKKWSQPKTYLPHPSQSIDILNNRSKKDSQSGQDAKSREFSSSNNVEDRKLMDTSFLYDIDEEISMTSPSTLSTHTTFQQDQQGFGRTSKAHLCKQENPFEVIRTNSIQKKKLPQSKPVGFDKGCVVKTPKKCNVLRDKDSFPAPEMTSTDSSSEKSLWLDFAVDSFPSNPFRKEKENRTPLQESASVAMTDGVTTKTQELRRPASNEDFAKYSSMMIRGLSVAEVTKIMAQDQVDPSIISLVMIAASESL
jgi:hypothetical protein